MVHYWLIAIGLFFGGWARGQVADFFLDPAGRPYYLLEDARLVTANPLGGNSYAFFDSSLGTPDYVDVTNPFQILVYYRDYGTAVVLDRTLNELDRIDFFALPGLQQPGAIARSYDNGIWVFDSWDYRLKRLNDIGEIDHQTNNLRLQLDLSESPDALFAGRNSVILYFAGTSRMAVFSNYGKFRYWVEVPPATALSWQAPSMLVFAEGSHHLWNFGDRSFTDLGPLPAGLYPDRRIRPVAGGYVAALSDSLGIREVAFQKR